MIIGIAGNLGVGKDTVANLMAKDHGFRTVSFAGALKALAARIFLYDDQVLWGESRFRSEPDARGKFVEYWEMVEKNCHDDPEVIMALDRLFPEELFEKAHEALIEMIHLDFRLKQEDLTPRYVLQRLGTEWGRKIYPDVWLRAVKTLIDKHPEDYSWVISDCRFADECRFVQNELKGKVVWIDASKRVARTGASNHVSEPPFELMAPYVDDIFDNNGRLNEIPGKIAKFLGVKNVWDVTAHSI